MAYRCGPLEGDGATPALITHSRTPPVVWSLVVCVAEAPSVDRDATPNNDVIRQASFILVPVYVLLVFMYLS